MRILGILLVIFGVVLLIYGGITFIIPNDVIRLGALSITIHENLVIPLPPIVGAISLLVGAFMILSAPVVRSGPPNVTIIE